jgi:hypothetical protein
MRPMEEVSQGVKRLLRGSPVQVQPPRRHDLSRLQP